MVFLASWLAGIAAYAASLRLFYGESRSISSGDFSSVLFWSFLAFAHAFILVYLPALFGLRRLLRGVRPMWPFPLVSVLLGVVSTAAIFSIWGGLSFRVLVSSEASLFYAMFAIVGLVVGFGFARIYRHDQPSTPAV